MINTDECNALEDAKMDYEEVTGKKWTKTEEKVVKICWFYNFTYLWNADGNLCINSMCETEEYNRESIYQFFGYDFTDEKYKLEHYEYSNSAEMVKSWESLCKKDNEDYQNCIGYTPFDWL